MAETSSRPLAPQLPLPPARRFDAPAGDADARSDAQPLPIASSPVALIDNFGSPNLSFAVSLGRRGVPLHIYGSGAGRWSRYAARREACPRVQDADRFVPWLRRKVRSGEIERVAPTTDLIAYYVSMLREDFRPDVRRTIAPLVEIERCLIKTRFDAACAHVKQSTPITEAPDNIDLSITAAQRLGFPLMMKPKSHLVVGEDRGRMVQDLSELRAAYRPYPIARGQESLAERYPELVWPLLQRYIPSARTRVFSVSGFKDRDGGIVAASLSCKRRQWPPDTGISTRQFSHNDERILQIGLQTVDRLVSCGVFELELLESDARLLAIDLNPRAFGFMGLDIALGNDLPWLWYQSTLRPLAAGPHLSTRPVVECRLPVPYYISRCVNRLLGVRDTDFIPGTAPQASAVLMLGDWSDPLPMLASNLRLLRHPGSLIRPYVRAAWSQRKNKNPKTSSASDRPNAI